ncbi:hypothetical protein RHSIM_Rhsim01G0155000 [Rhododendron simsii]|uniref:Uncharacterized protein n=1 Tax=Rhododendron simsii TaxID=118357 RepID=A0A834HEJ5_RHOSS|nr:hypothetical protein RHSIM_Rhsim01G0155000 [Rhododendron simsii]
MEHLMRGCIKAKEPICQEKENSSSSHFQEEDDDMDDHLDLVEEVAETEGNNVGTLPNVSASDVAHDAGKLYFENRQLVLFKDNSKD